MCGQYRLRGKVIVKYDEETEEFIGNVEQLEGDIADLTKTAQTPGGISLFTDKDKTTYKSTYQLLKDISGIYHDLTDKQQAGLLEKLAGKRGGQVLAGLLDDFSEVERAMSEIEKSAGSADNEMSIIEESIEYKVNALRQTWVNTLQQIIDKGQLGQIVDGLTGVSEALGFVIDKVGLLNLGGFGLEGLLMSKGLGFVNYDQQKDNGENIISGIYSPFIDFFKSSTLKSFNEDTEDFLNVLSHFTGTKDDLHELIVGYNDLDKEIAESASDMFDAGQAGEEIADSLRNAIQEGGNLGAVLKSLGSIGLSMGITLAIETLIQVMVSCATASDRLYEKASKLGQEFRTTESDINSYKTQIKDLQDKINDSSTSIEESRQAREDLLKIQDDLILKYGSEKSAIYDITEAINGEVDALDKLKDAKWAQTLADFEKSDSWIDAIGDWFNRTSRFGIANEGSNLEAMMSDMDRAYKIINVAAGDSGLAREFGSAYDSLKVLQDGFIEIDGNIYDAYDDLNSFYTAMKNGGASATSLRYIANEMNRLKNQIDSAGELYNEVILRDRILDGGAIEETYNKYLSSYEKYKNAYADGNKELVSEQINDLLQIRQDLQQTLTDKIAAGEITPAVKDSIIRSFANLYPELQSELDKMDFRINTPSLKQLDSSLTSDDILKDLSEQGTTVNESIFNHILEQAEEAGIVYGNDAENVHQLLDLLVEWEIIQAGITSKVEATGESISDWNLESALSKFNIDSAAFEKYLEIFKKLNPELAKFEEKCEQAAVAQYAFDQSVEDLRSHLNDYVENLETLDETSVEYANSIQSIASDLTALTGVDFSITDAQTFMQDKTNLDLLRQALDGDNAALDRLRANASRTIVANIVANTQIDTDEFWQQYNELVNWMIANPNIGTLEAKSYLDESPFVQSCLRMIAQGKMTAEQLQAIFAAQGWDFKYDTKTVDVWLSGGSVPKNKTGMAGDLGIGAGAGRYSLHKETITVPTNIRYERKNSGRTAPSITKPTSSSGANYKPEQKTGSGGGGGGGGSSPKSTDEKKEEKDPTEEAKEEEKEVEDTYDEFFDFFERRLKVVSDAISLLDTNLENVVGSKAKNSLLDAQMRIYKMQQDEYSGAKKMYQEMADRALEKIDDEDIVKRIKNGAIAIDEFIGKGNEEVVNAINDYTKWADKVADCKEELAKLKEELRQLELERFKNIAQDWQDVFDLRKNNSIDLIDKQIDLIEETGNLVGRSFYETQKQQTQKMLDTLRKEREELVAEMSRGLSDGTIDKGSDEWLEMVNTLSDLEGEIIDTTKGIEELDNSILNIHTEVFERIQDQFSDLDDEISDIVGFLEDAKPGDDFGNWTKEGIAQAGLLAQQYELATKRTQSLSNEISYLKAQYSAGAYSATEYADKLADLTQQQRDSAKAAEDAKKSIISLNKARIDIEIEAIQKDIEQYKKLIDVQKQSLQSQKDLHDYEKNIAGQNRNISDIERRLAAMSGDNTASTIAKRKALEKELSDARMELEETEYDHSITSQQDALDQQAEQYEMARQAEIDKLNEYLENETQVLSDTFESVKARALEIGQTIAQTAQEHGIQVSESLTAAWKAGSDAIASYGEVLTPATSEFIAQLEDVEEHTWELQEQADVTSVQLAAMFANRADNLVDELQRSWDSEANLNEMTKALEDSFVHTIDTAGHIGEIVASNMAEAEAATDAVKDAAESAADAFNDMADSASAAGSAARSAISDLNALEAKANDSSWKSGTAYEPPYKTHYTSVYNAPYSGVQWDSIGGHYKKKAKGLRKADQNELMWTQELGDEVIVSPTRNSILTPIKAGDSVLTAGMTKNLWELAKVDPKQLLEGNGANISAPQIQSNNTSVQIGTLVNVEGSISDDNLTDVKQTIQEELKKTFRNINSGLLR